MGSLPHILTIGYKGNFEEDGRWTSMLHKCPECQNYFMGDDYREICFLCEIAKKVCGGCHGYGEIGGLRPDGYYSDPCPFCNGSGIDPDS